MIFRLLSILLLVFASSCGGPKREPQFGKYSIGRDETWFPLNFKLQTPRINAFVNAVVGTIARTEHVSMEIIDVDWDTLYAHLEEGSYAGVFSSLPLTPQNLDRYTFSDPFLLIGPVLVVPEHAKATSMDELGRSALIGINQFDDSVLIAQKYPELVIQLYQNMPAALEDLAAGRLDAVLIPSLDAHALVPHLYNGVLKIVTPPLSEKGLRVVTLKGQNEALIHHFNRGLAELKTTHQYRRLREKFGVY